MTAELDREATVIRRCAELETSVRTELAAQHSDDELSVHLDALYAACELAAARFEATTTRLDGQPDMLDRLIEVAEITRDHVSRSAELGLQNVLDRLRGGEVSKRDLANLARVVTANLGDAEAAIEAALATRRRARHDVDRWIDAIATAERHDHADLADAARARLAVCHADVATADAVLFEYAELRASLREVGRLILDRG